MPLTELGRQKIGEFAALMLADPRPLRPVLESPRGEAVLAGNIRLGEGESDRAGVLVEDEPCLVILSRRLAVAYGLTPPAVMTPPPMPLPDEEPGEQGFKVMRMMARPDAGDDGICIWDPVTGEIHCTGGALY